MFRPFKASLFSFSQTGLPLGSVVLLGLMLLGAPSQAQEAASPDARVDRLQAQMIGLQAKIHMAQGYGYGAPPDDVGGGDGSYNSPPPRRDAAGLEVRIGHIEEQMRQMNGQIEQMQFAQHKLEDQLKKFQQDVDFRFQDRAGSAARPQKRTEAPESEIGAPANPSVLASGAPDQPPSNGAVPLHGSRRGGDAFDPSADPNAPGAPHPLGSIASSSTALAPPPAAKIARNEDTPNIIADEEQDPNAPLNLSSARRSATSSSTPTNGASGYGTAAAPRQIPLDAPPTTPSSVSGNGSQMAGIPQVASPKEEFDAALGYFKQREYENAEKSFSAFLQKNPKNRMSADAVYYLGETYFQRGRQREAAEQYLKISTNYSTSAHAPEAMLRLGQSLNALGAKEQACATFGEVPRKYPNASALVKTNAEKEAQRAKC